MAKALLVEIGMEGHPEETKSLLDTLGYETAEVLTFNVRKINPGYYIGKGQTELLKCAVRFHEPDIVCFDSSLSPLVLRNLEAEIDCDIMDREAIILEIFSRRAGSREARLQVDLARALYYLPRQRGRKTDLSQQRGGVKGSRGEGERLLELDKRRLYEEIERTKHQLEIASRTRETKKKARSASPLFRFAIVGYTNAGKSSLLNRLSSSDVLAEDKLFATLDPSTRMMRLNGEKILLSDTVGFVSNLPHLLVEAFKSTLEEANDADALIIVLDALSFDPDLAIRTTRTVLQEIGADQKPSILVLNKVDAEQDEVKIRRIMNENPGIIPVSVKTGFNLDSLLDKMGEYANGRCETMSLLLPLSSSSLIGKISRDGTIESIEYLDDGIHVKARIRRIYYEKYRKFAN